MKLKVGDKVKVIAGSSKGKEGKITKTLRNENRVIVEGVNIVKKHKKGNGQETGGILEVEAPIHISNVKLVSEDKKEVKKEEKKEVKKPAAKKSATKKASK